MQFSEVVDLGFEMWKAGSNKTITLLGPPGIGKSSVAPAIAERMTAYTQSKYPAAARAVCEVIDLSARMPEDIGGVPFRAEMQLSREESITVCEYAIQKWLARLCRRGVYGVLLLDDLPAANPSVQVASRQLVLDRRIGDVRLPDSVLVMVTGNRRQDKSAAATLPAHFRNAVLLLSIEPSLEDWTAWYGRQPGHAPIVSSFLAFRSNLLSTLPKDADEMGAFATPRAWASLGRVYEISKAMGKTLEVAQGFVGQGPATEFMAFVNIRSQLVDPAAVLADPRAALPDPRATLNSPDKAYAMVTGIAEIAAEWAKGADRKKRDEAPLAFMRAIGHATDGNQEYIATAINTFLSSGGDTKSLIHVVSKHKNTDPLVGAAAQFLARAFE